MILLQVNGIWRHLSDLNYLFYIYLPIHSSSSCSVTGTLFLVTCVIAFLRFGDQLRYNLLQGLPPSGPLLADELLVTLQICLSMVVSGTALFQDIEHNLGVSKGRSFNLVSLFFLSFYSIRSSLITKIIMSREAFSRVLVRLPLYSNTGKLIFF